MSLRNEPLDWQVETNNAYIPIYHQGNLVGFFKQEYASEIISFLNDEEVFKKALKLACTDLIKKMGGDTNKVNYLIHKYVKSSERPKYGTRAIALLLRDRQKELDLSNPEFAKFCDTFKVSPTELNNIYAGEPFDDSLLAPLSRILGIAKERLLEVRDGLEKESNV
ncbi:hypothetical protein VF14_05950 [Nostoc linckia z18]|uniref:Uncharacterized protein n=3 Tax=Nostoc linckia TaxID=92942 RepID=A0A9Q6EMC6_NOSLI|nr:hypothetical protein [Nostoc linckia]PHK10577.1 hypothetical protein VF10_35430 [Nostoc linckia z13]PHK38922.1 hypothetical protein VF12_16205 [Nostoc linckia z15]PHK47779.1 hypothetical protein VF13_03810 [Nostoc linckia z16]PHJ65997.1 hypothetical protein VF02_09155 [Nostoc linckia z1]PHJ68903.1 hypothetical protein VF05_14790 [Nostoc linckia z3]